MDWNDIKSDAKDCIKGNRVRFYLYMLFSSFVLWAIATVLGIVFSIIINIFNVILNGSLWILLVYFILYIPTFLIIFGLSLTIHLGLISNMLEVYNGMSIDIGRMFKYTKYIVSNAGVFWSIMWRMFIPGYNIIASIEMFAMLCIKAENPYMKAHFCWKRAHELMNGHKFNFFLFSLSFVPQMFIGVILFPLGIYWIPYMLESMVVYYAYATGMENGGYAQSLNLNIDTTPEIPYANMDAGSNVNVPKKKGLRNSKK